MKYISNILTTALLLGMSFSVISCQGDDICEQEEGFTYFTVRPLMSSSVSATRTTPRPDDGFTIYNFTEGDLCGFFSESGDKNNSNAGFTNAPMIYRGGVFNGGDAMNVDVNHTGNTCLYYPYNSAPNGRQNIRNKDGEVIDLLIAHNAGYIDQYKSNNETIDVHGYAAVFTHAFSMVIITGEEGFTNFMNHEKAPSITLIEPVEWVELVKHRTDSTLCNIQFGCSDNNNEEYKTLKGHQGKYNDKDAYFIIFPTNGTGLLKTLNVYDDGGTLHKIDLTVYNGGIKMGYKYPLTLKFDEMVPSIFRDPIILWNTIDISTNDSRGISTTSAFNEWMLAYNQENRDENKLREYGDLIEVEDENGNKTGEKYWHFYLTADIDLSSITKKDVGHLITNLTDVFDGNGHKISGVKLEGENAALCSTIDGKRGQLTNLTIDNMTIETSGNNPVGALTTNFKSGKISNCTVTNLTMNTESEVGALAGTISGNENDISVSNCTFSGIIYGTGTESKLIGSGNVPTAVKKECDISNVMFGKI